MKALFPGSFDPFTIGHLSLINRCLPIFDKIVIAIGCNADKKYLFPIEERKEWIKKIFHNNNKIEIVTYNKLTVEFAKELKINFLIRGLRTAVDFEYERQIGLINRTLAPEIETIYLMTLPEYSHISSSMVREIIKYKGSIDKLVPLEIATEIYKKYYL